MYVKNILSDKIETIIPYGMLSLHYPNHPVDLKGNKEQYAKISLTFILNNYVIDRYIH